MIELSASVTGEVEIAASLARFPATLRGRVVRALEELGEETRRAAAYRAPAGTGRQSKASKRYGRLRDNIRSRVFADEDRAAARINLGDAFWGKFIEHGMPWKSSRVKYNLGPKSATRMTGAINPKTGKWLKKRRRLTRALFERKAPAYAAHPFMAPTAESMRSRVETRIAAVTAEAAQEVR